MNEIIRQEGNDKIDLAAYKSVYYWANAKPDTSIRIFNDSRKIHLENIISLNESVQEKLKNHDPLTSIATIDIIFRKGKIKTFSAWNEFIATNWEIISDTIESISIKWDINLILPNYQLPQRHTMKVRIGSGVKPSEYFQLMVAGDSDVEEQEGKAFVVCKVDFVNTVIASELISIVENWYNCLSKTLTKGWVQTFVEDYKNSISRIAHYLISTAGLVVTYIFFKWNLQKQEINSFNQESYSNLYFWILLIFVVYFVSDIIGRYFGELIYKNIYKLNEPNIFEVSKGDKLLQEELNTKNKKIYVKISVWFLGALGSAIIAIIVERLIF